MQEQRKGLSRRQALAGPAAVALAAAAPAAVAQPAAAKVLNDASRLNPTPVARHILLADQGEESLIASLRAALKEAESEGRAVSMGCARHSMGGQSLHPDGTALSFDMSACVVSPAGGGFIARAGTRWRHVLARLDEAGFSPAVTQSNNDFGIAGTLSVNAHGWPAPFGPAGTTVRWLRLMLADGTLLRCSREENAELFSLVLGGYGLFGIIVDAELEMVPNAWLAPRFDLLPGKDFGSRFAAAVTGDPSLRMAFGRLSVDRARFMQEALMVTFREGPAPPGGLPRMQGAGFVSTVSREIFRAQLGSDAAKRRRWTIESVVAPKLAPAGWTRNTLLNTPVEALAGRDRKRTDILHEYFVPPGRWAEFVAACADLIPASAQDLLNVTLRHVEADRLTVLSFAPETRVAAVMLFSQAMTAEAEADMRRLTEGLVDRVLALGGSFYLPYRLHARVDQVRAAYPALDRFVAAKRRYDPKLRFRNALWDTYFSA